MIPFPVAILAGGLGTRLGELTRNRPKAMVEVNGEPFIGHVLRLLAEQDYRQVVICTGHLGGDISAYVKDGSQFGVHVMYSHDGPMQLGTGGALRKAAPLLGNTFMVLYGDSCLDCDYRAVQAAFVHGDCPALMAVCEVPEGYRPNVQYAAGEVVRYSKKVRHSAMRHIDYGLGVLDSHVLLLLPDGLSDLADLYQDLAVTRALAGYDVGRRFYTIGTPAGLVETSRFLARSGLSARTAAQ